MNNDVLEKFKFGGNLGISPSNDFTEMNNKYNTIIQHKNALIQEAKEKNDDLESKILLLEQKLIYNADKRNDDMNIEQIASLQKRISSLIEEKTFSKNMLEFEKYQNYQKCQDYQQQIKDLKAELAEERRGPSRAEIAERCERQVAAYGGLLRRALELTVQDNGPVVPGGDDVGEIEAYLGALRAFLVGGAGQPEAAARGGGGWAFPPKKAIRPGTKCVVAGPGGGWAELPYDAGPLAQALGALPEPKRAQLLGRFADICRAHAASRAATFSEMNGLPSVKENPAVLVNHIARLSTEKEALTRKLEHITEEVQGLKSAMAKMEKLDENRKNTPILKRSSIYTNSIPLGRYLPRNRTGIILTPRYTKNNMQEKHSAIMSYSSKSGKEISKERKLSPKNTQNKEITLRKVKSLSSVSIKIPEKSLYNIHKPNSITERKKKSNGISKETKLRIKISSI